MIDVCIKGVTHAWDPNFGPQNPAWQRKNDWFCSAVIGGTPVLAKRFSGAPPSAWDLLLDLQRQPLPHCPLVYDCVGHTEQEQPVYYVLYEKLQGQTLDLLVDPPAASKPEPRTLFRQMQQVLVGLAERGYWMTDLNEQNIWVSKNRKKLYLIDLDSCAPVSVRPSHDPAAPGGLQAKAQEYAIPVFEFSAAYLDRSLYDFTPIDGPTLNQLQLLFFLEQYCSGAGPIAVHQQLYQRNPGFATIMVKKALNGGLIPAMATEMAKFVTGELKAEAAVAPAPAAPAATSPQAARLQHGAVTDKDGEGCLQILFYAVLFWFFFMDGCQKLKNVLFSAQPAGPAPTGQIIHLDPHQRTLLFTEKLPEAIPIQAPHIFHPFSHTI
ncbi:MAG: serine/threonine protein kinase [Saprospiraceae bacterium]|nr:serine/threonine protein kinase [Saprospiraceae bacterium]